MTAHPAILLHGFTGHASSWDDVIRALPAPEKTRAYTLVGHDGRPHDGEVSPNAFEREVSRLASLMSADLRGERACLCGYSMGGRVALVLLVRHPELFASAVIIGASPGLASSAERAQREASDEQWALMLLRDGVDRFVDAWEQNPLFATQRHLPAAVLRRQRRLRAQHCASGLAHAVRTLGLAQMPNLLPELDRIDVPVLLVAGELDAKYRAVAERMQSRVRSSRLEIVAGAGHNVVLERPQAVAEILARHRNALGSRAH